MNIRFYNCTILTMENECTLTSGEVWIFDHLVGYVGPSKDSKNIPWDKEYNLAGNLIMPGFKNAHTHSAMTFLRSLADDLPLDVWLNKRVFPKEAKLTTDHMYTFSKIAIMEYLTSGITSNFDMYIDPTPIVDASVDCGFRTVVVSGLNNFTQSVPEIEECYKKYNGYNDLISYVLGFHGEYTCSKNLLEDLAQVVKKHQAPVFCHNSETKKEVDECIKRYGVSPTVFMDKLGLFDYGGGSYHFVHVNKDDIDICVKHDLSVITNPGSNSKLASGIAPISELLSNNINVAIGTDGPASNNALDMFREMYLTSILAKIKDSNPSSVDGNTVLKIATVNGAQAMGLYNCKTLSVGQLADLIVIDLEQPNMQPINNITKNLVYSGSKSNVMLTMVNGRVLYEKGEFNIGVEPCVVYEEARNLIKKM